MRAWRTTISDYNKITNFTVKDSLTTGEPEKTILGEEIDDELDAIATAITSKAELTDVTAAVIGAALYPRTSKEIAQSVTPTDYSYPPGHAFRYGATGNGTTDDTTALQNCLKSNDQSDVVIPVGTYVTSASLSVYNQNITGLGTREYVIFKPTGNFECFVNAGHEFITGSLRRILIIYNNGVQPASSVGNDRKIGLYWTTVSGRSPSYFDVEDVEVRGAWWAHYDDSGSYACNFSRFFMRECQNGFAKLNGTTFTLNQVIGLNVNKGFYLSNNDDFSLHACANDGAVVTAGGSANEFISCVSFTITSFDVEGNAVSGNASTLFSFSDCAGTFMGLSGHNNTFSEAAGFTSYLSFSDSFVTVSGHRHRRSSGVSELTMTGNGTYYGVLATSGSKISVIGSEVLNPTTASGTPTYRPFHATGTARVYFLGCSTDGTIGSNSYELISETTTQTGTLTGCTTSPTGSVICSRNGRIVTVYVPAIAGTSNTTAATITGAIPSSMYPARSQNCITSVVNNTVTAAGLAQVGTGGTITLFPTVAGGSFTAAGSKGVDPGTFTYSLE